MLDKEIPWNQVPEKDRPLYVDAEKAEWNEWLRRGSVRILSAKESSQVKKTTDPRRIIGLRFVYRDKNASIRTPQAPLPIKAKARLCAQAFNEPLAREGLVKVDSPTIQRVGVMIFLQMTVNFGWTKHWRSGDIKAAFLQGKERDSEKLGKLYLSLPKKNGSEVKLEGVGNYCLL